MSLQNRRLERATEQILREELQRGNLPSSREFSWRLNQYLEEQDLGRPEYVYRAVKDGTMAYAADMNGRFGAIKRDLELLYVNMEEVQTILGKHFSMFEVEKASLEKEVRQVETRLREKILLFAEAGYLTAVFDVFDDMEHVELSACHNVVIDTARHEVRLKEELNRSERVMPPEKTSFAVRTNVTSSRVRIAGEPEDMHVPFQDKAWQEAVLTKENVRLTAELELSWTLPVRMNQVEMDLFTVGPMLATIEVSGDGMNWSPLPYHEGPIATHGQIDVKFLEQKVQGLRVRLEKPEADEAITDGEWRYRYLFGVKRFESRVLRFPTEGVFQSKARSVGGPSNYLANKIALHVEEMVPDNAGIDYAVRLKGDTEWRSISPRNRTIAEHSQLVDLGRLATASPETMAITGELALNQYTRPDLAVNGTTFYRLGKVTGRRIVSGSERLYRGRNAWQVKSFAGTFPEGHRPTLEDWRNPLSEVKEGFRLARSGAGQMLLDGERQASPTSFYCKAGLHYAGDAPSVLMSPTGTDPFALYVNGSLVYSGTGGESFQAPMRRGWNEIVVLVYSTTCVGVNGASLSVGVDVLDAFNGMYMDASPLEKVSLFDLRYNTRADDRSRYAIEEKADGYEVILNHAFVGLEYAMAYEYQTVFLDDSENEVELRATFRKEGNESMSPVLYRYRIEMS